MTVISTTLFLPEQKFSSETTGLLPQTKELCRIEPAVLLESARLFQLLGRRLHPGNEFCKSIGGDELLADLPDILEKVRFSTDEISVDLLCSRMTDNSDSYYFWSITLRIGHVSISFVQVQAKGSKVNKPGNNIFPKRMLHISSSGFYALPYIPVAGDVSLPFDMLHLCWLNPNLRLSEKKLLD